MEKQRIVAIILALLFGMYGVHWFYLNENNKGIKYLIATLIGLATCFIIIGIVPLCVIFALSIIDLFNLAIMSDDQFNEKYNVPTIV